MKCNNEDCDKEVKEGYKFCYECYTKWQANQKESGYTPMPKNAWHDDPVVDVLLKINANLGNMLEELKKWNHDLEPSTRTTKQT